LPDQPNPYESFKKVKPVAEIGDGVFVYEGHFDMSLPAAYHHAKESEMALSEGRIDDAIKEGLIAYRLAPDLPKAERALRQAREHDERGIPSAAAGRNPLVTARSSFPVPSGTPPATPDAPAMPVR